MFIIMLLTVFTVSATITGKFTLLSGTGSINDPGVGTFGHQTPGARWGGSVAQDSTFETIVLVNGYYYSDAPLFTIGTTPIYDASLANQFVMSPINPTFLPSSISTDITQWKDFQGSCAPPPGTPYQPSSSTLPSLWLSGDRLYLFGGKVLVFSPIIYISFSSDMVYLDLSTYNWYWLAGPSNQECISNPRPDATVPPGRHGAVSWTHVDSLNNTYFYVWGGVGGIINGTRYTTISDFKYDTWRFNGSFNTDGLTDEASDLRFLWEKRNVTTVPTPRAYAAQWIDHKGNVWIYGGRGSNGSQFQIYSDMWKWHHHSENWTQISDTAPNTVPFYGTQGVTCKDHNRTHPGARQGAGTWVENTANGTQRFWLFGGSSDTSNSTNESFNNTYNDLWMFDPSTREWTWVNGSTLVNQQGSYNGTANPYPGGLDLVQTWNWNNGTEVEFVLYAGHSNQGAKNDYWTIKVHGNPGHC